jgi:tetratricopeptide (TPR) repeat protein
MKGIMADEKKVDGKKTVETKAARTQKGEKVAGNGFVAFVANNRKAITVCSITVLVVAAALIGFFGINGMLEARKITELEELLTTFSNHNGEVGPNIQSDSIIKLLEDLNAFGEKASGYAAAEAYSLAGSIYNGQKKFPESEEAYLAAAKKGAKTFLAAIAWYNAGIAADEQGKTDEAINYFKECLKHEDFTEKARVQFALGRLFESQKNSDAALESYRVILDKWSGETSWANLAQSRIIALEVGL